MSRHQLRKPCRSKQSGGIFGNAEHTVIYGGTFTSHASRGKGEYYSRMQNDGP